MPPDWRNVLRAWVAGVEVDAIGADNMKLVEDVFTYKLVWAIEALRTRRVVQGWEPDIYSGGAAASLETGVPDYKMSMLIRAGLPSRRAAMVAVVDGDADYFDSAGMREWLESDGIVDRTAAGDWPTEETAALWGRFHSEALSDAIQRWRRVVGVRPYVDDVDIEPGIYRIERDEAANENWLVTADYRRVSRLGGTIRFTNPSLFTGVHEPNAPVVRIERLGGGMVL